MPHCVAVANATLGLELVLNALPRKGQVIVPSFTFIASAHAIVRTGHTPVFVDVDSRGLIDPQAVAAAVGPETVAILPVNLFGLVCDVERLSDIASSAGARLIYDSAHALGVSSAAASAALASVPAKVTSITLRSLTVRVSRFSRYS